MDPDVARKIRSPWLWLVPVGAVVVLMSLLAATYVGSVADPQKHLEKFPVLLVNEDDGGRLPAPDGGEGPEQNFGAQIVSGLEKGSDTEKFDLEVVDSDTAFRRLDNAEAYGAIVIPRNFTSASIEFAGSAVGFTQVDRPVIQVWTNPGAGALASSIVTAYADTALTEANTTFGKQLAAGVIDQAKQAGLTVSGASLLGLAAPIDIRIDPADPLPGNAGNGLTAFYFALLLVLAGFTGSVIVQTLVDGMLGFGPMEVGPLYRLMAPLKISRWGTLVIKWWIMFVIALVLASVYLLVCRVVGMDLSNAFALWMFGVLVITAVGVTCMSVAAALGSFGLLVNMVVFVVLGLPSWGHRPAGGHPLGVPLARVVRADAPGVSGRPGDPVLRRQLLCRARSGAGDDRRGPDHRIGSGRRGDPGVRPQGMGSCTRGIRPSSPCGIVELSHLNTRGIKYRRLNDV